MFTKYMNRIGSSSVGISPDSQARGPVVSAHLQTRTASLWQSDEDIKTLITQMSRLTEKTISIIINSDWFPQQKDAIN
ncbi:hypothetical protein SK128_003309 [Halocaridina rubra]|uniref:Uncharacterized protein n=1 Tax=Halocaridina rubra TaxID=373956 RepID=A0AAN8X6T8_HALRR